MSMAWRLSDRNHAPMRHFTHRVLELDCSVINGEISMEAGFYFAEDALAGGGWNVSDGNVAR